MARSNSLLSFFLIGGQHLRVVKYSMSLLIPLKGAALVPWHDCQCLVQQSCWDQQQFPGSWSCPTWSVSTSSVLFLVLWKLPSSHACHPAHIMYNFNQGSQEMLINIILFKIVSMCMAPYSLNLFLSLRRQNSRSHTGARFLDRCQFRPWLWKSRTVSPDTIQITTN